VAFTKVFTICQNTIAEFIPSIIFLYPPHHIPGIVSTGICFHLHSCVHSIGIILTLLHPFPISSTLPLVPTPPVLPFCFPILLKKYFCLFMIATHGVSLWHFHICMYYNPNWFISTIFLLSTLVPFLWWFQQI
jgi:hypothetical protein